MANSETLLVSVPEAGRRLSVGRSTALELVASGRLGSVKVGARRLVPVAELERFVAELCDAAQISERLKPSAPYRLCHADVWRTARGDE